MTSTTSLNKPKSGFGAMYRWSLAGLLNTAVVYTVMLILVLPVFELAQIVSSYYYTDYEENIVFMLGFVGTYARFVPLVIGVFTVVVAAKSFNIFHNKRSVDLYLSLPAKRSTLFLARFLSGVTVMLVPLFAATVIGGIVGGDIGYAVLKFLAMVPNVLACFTMFAFLAVCCGTVADTIVSFCLINVAYPCCYFIMNVLVTQFSPGDFYAGLGNTLSAVSPFGVSLLSPLLSVFICGSDILPYNEHSSPYSEYPVVYSGERGIMGVDYSVDNILSVAANTIYWLLFVAVLLVAAIIIFKRRKNENVQSGFIYKLPKVLIIFLSSIGCGFLCGYLGEFIFGFSADSHFSVMMWYVIWAVIGCFVSYLIVTCIYNRGGAGFLKTLPIFVVSVVFVSMFYFLSATGVVNCGDGIPEESQVEGVSVSASVNGIYDNAIFRGYYSDEYGMMHEYIDDATVIKSSIDLHKKLVKEFYENSDFVRSPSMYYSYNVTDSRKLNYVNIKYLLKDGREIKKQFDCSMLDEDEICKMLDSMYSTKVYKEAKFGIAKYDDDVDVDISLNKQKHSKKTIGEVLQKEDTEFAKEFMNTYKEELMNDKHLYTTLEDSEIYMVVSLTYNGSYTDYSWDEYLYIPENGYEKTKAVLKKYKKEFDEYDYVEFRTCDTET